MSHLLQSKQSNFFIILLVTVSTLLVSVFTVYAGGGGGAGGSSGGGSNPSGTGSTPRAQTGTHAVTTDRNLANSVARDLNSRPNSMCSGCSATVTSNRDGTVSVSVRENDRGGNDNQITNPGTTKVTTPTCTDKNLTTIDIFFVRAGAQPVTTPARTVIDTRGGTRPSERVRTVIPASTSYAPIMVSRNELQVGVSYEPIAQIRNSASCSSGLSNSHSGGDRDRRNDLGPRTQLFNIITPAYAGGSSDRTPRPNDYPNNVRNQLPFGTNGSFPIRARIDVGNNTIIDWEHYLNAIGPLSNGQTMYLRLPTFTTTEVGTHSIEIITDIRHSIDPGRGCFAPTTPDSAGWGCVRETNERDNDRRETFTTVGSSTSASVRVEVDDISVPARSTLTQVPFNVTNSGVQTVTNYRYTVQIGSRQFANTNRTTTLTPTQRELVSAVGSYNVPNTNTSVPITVCAQVGTSTQSCDTARLLVVTPQCSDGRDNDADATADDRDTGCYTDPLDPSSYDPDDNSESDAGPLMAPNITLEAESKFVRSNSTTRVTYSVQAAYPMTCTLRGPGINDTFTYTTGTLERTVTTAALINKQNVSISCAPTGVPAGSYQPTTREITIEIIPKVQEV